MEAKVTIRVGLREGITRLRESYFTPPFKVANITEDKGSTTHTTVDKRSPFLQLMLMCSSPGILEGDDYALRVVLEEGSRLQLHTQSYQRLFQMKEGARQSMEVRMERGATFTYLPHPTVPHAGAVFTGRNKIFLSDGCRLAWGEILTCGRKLSGEMFAFSKYRQITEIFLHDKLVLKENICLEPLRSDVQGIGQLEGYTHQASLLLMGGRDSTGRDAGEEIRMRLAELLEGENLMDGRDASEGIVGGVSEGPAGILVVRLLGNKAEPLYDLLKMIVKEYAD